MYAARPPSDSKATIKYHKRKSWGSQHGRTVANDEQVALVQLTLLGWYESASAWNDLFKRSTVETPDYAARSYTATPQRGHASVVSVRPANQDVMHLAWY